MNRKLAFFFTCLFAQVSLSQAAWNGSDGDWDAVTNGQLEDLIVFTIEDRVITDITITLDNSTAFVECSSTLAIFPHIAVNPTSNSSGVPFNYHDEKVSIDGLILETNKATGTLSYDMGPDCGGRVTRTWSTSNSPAPPSLTVVPKEGLWWNPVRSGHGMDIEVTNGQLFVVWYTYNDDNSPVWYLAQGAFNSYQWSAGMDAFRWNPDSRTATPTRVGKLSINFLDPRHGLFSWVLNGKTGSEIIEYFVVDHAPPAFDVTGTWYEPALSGYGLTVSTQAEIELAVLYFYDQSGAPRWALGNNGGSGASTYTLSAYTGFCPGCPWASIRSVPAGTVTTEFTDARSGFLSTDINLSAPLTGGWNVLDASISNLSNP
ncbi:MAG: hypothetical protein KAG26_08980 [Methylococcales bacterium]|nr:hypothetical protein [Methylococcales bacterium]